MPVHIYRCAHCGREVLVREAGPLTPAEVARRIEEETRPWSRGPSARPDGSIRLRDDIWVGVASTRTEVPRDALPDRCPACMRAATLMRARAVD